MDHLDATKRCAMAAVCSSEAPVIDILTEATMNIQRWYSHSHLVIWIVKITGRLSWQYEVRLCEMQV